MDQKNKLDSTENSSQLKKMTTAFGAPVANDDDTKTAGKRGPLLMEDVWFLEKLAILTVK